VNKSSPLLSFNFLLLIAFGCREDAFDVFQSTGASEFLMAASLEELRDFIGRHWPSTPPPVFIVSGHSVVVRDL
jgi:hypothetical protein